MNIRAAQNRVLMVLNGLHTIPPNKYIFDSEPTFHCSTIKRMTTSNMNICTGLEKTTITIAWSQPTKEQYHRVVSSSFQKDNQLQT